jgi:hypothetical protein
MSVLWTLHELKGHRKSAAWGILALVSSPSTRKERVRGLASWLWATDLRAQPGSVPRAQHYFVVGLAVIAGAICVRDAVAHTSLWSLLPLPFLVLMPRLSAWLHQIVRNR